MDQESKMPVVRAVDLGSCDIVLDGDPAAPKSAQPPPQFLAHVCFAKRTDRILFYPTLRQTAEIEMCLISVTALHHPWRRSIIQSHCGSSASCFIIDALCNLRPTSPYYPLVKTTRPVYPSVCFLTVGLIHCGVSRREK